MSVRAITVAPPADSITCAYVIDAGKQRTYSTFRGGLPGVIYICDNCRREIPIATVPGASVWKIECWTRKEKQVDLDFTYDLTFCSSECLTGYIAGTYT